MKRAMPMTKHLILRGAVAVMLAALLPASSLLPFAGPLHAEASRIRRAGGDGEETAGEDGSQTAAEDAGALSTETLSTEILSAEELKALSDSLDPDENGFFLSTYTRPEEIRWEEVFYDGAGISLPQQDPDYAGARESLLSMYGEQAGTLYVLRSEDIERFARRKTGVNYGLSRHPLLLSQRFTYLYDLDLYVTEHSDSNRQQIRFVSGRKEGDLYSLTYTVMDPQYGYAFRDFVMQAVIRDGEWTYMSNLPAAAEVSPRELLLIDFYDTREEAETAAGEGTLDATGLREPREMGYSDMETVYYCVATSLGNGIRVRLDRTDPQDDAAFMLKTDGIYMPDEELYSAVLDEGEKLLFDTAMLWYPVLRLSASDGIRYGDYWFGEDLGLHLGLDADSLPGAHLQRYIVGTPALLRVSDEKDLDALLSGAFVAKDAESGQYTGLLFGRGQTVTVRRPDWEIEEYSFRYGELPAPGSGDPYTLLVTGYAGSAAGAEGAEDAPPESAVRVSFVQKDGERTLTAEQDGEETVYRQPRGMMSWQAGYLEVLGEYAGRFDTWSLYAGEEDGVPDLILHRKGRQKDGEEYLAFRYAADPSGDNGSVAECGVPEGVSGLPAYRAGTDLPILRYGTYPAPDSLPGEGAAPDEDAVPDGQAMPEPDAGQVVILCPADPALQAGSIMYGELAEPGTLLKDPEVLLTADGSADADLDRDGRYEKIRYMTDAEGDRRIRAILHEQDGNLYAYISFAAADETVTADGFLESAETGTRTGTVFSREQFFEYTVTGYDG